MQNIYIGCQVRLAQFTDYIFTVTAQHNDGSFTVQTKLSEEQILTYQNVAQEMLQLIE
ncbi:hypothetical protein [Acinetobacter sp. NCu2D-2]|uniref:hypothetical protein n=1 Tax=Acinetobacter sp. NCu2D-2 TaxID=1608473 RepID=UPI0014884B2F|nr:hypothetical protein [Acinetobacter sp. NCu2D-2]